MNRCKSCILPDTYPGIQFSNKGICHFCTSYKPKDYWGEEKLREDILCHKGKRYDCLVGFSGGRDSSYLLWYFVRKLGLRVVAYSANNGFMPGHTLDNMRRISEILGVRLIVKEHMYLKKCLKSHLKAWMKKPDASSIGLLCVGCRLGMDLGTYMFAVREKIPVIAVGGTRFEGKGYKINVFKHRNSYFRGIVKQVLRNPYWIVNPVCLLTQGMEFWIHYRRILRKRNIKYISPFSRYIEWKEKTILSVIEKELEWTKNPKLHSTWRGDCDVAILKGYLYKKALGFNDWDDGLSALVRDQQISREEALMRLKKEGSVSEEIVEEILSHIGISFPEFKKSIMRFS